MSDQTFQRALAAYHGNDLRTAGALCKEIVKHDRRNIRALDLLGQIAWETGEPDESIALHRQAVKAAPKNARLRTNLGRAYARNGRHQEAIRQYDEALKLEPEQTAAVSGKADSFMKRGKYDQARRVLERVIGRYAGDAAVAVAYVRVLIRAGELERAIEIGRAAIESMPAPNDYVRSLHFETARALERHGDHDAAFELATRANAILPPAYDPRGMAHAVDVMIDAFSADRLAVLPRAAVSGPAPIFVFSIPRSGTTLTERILDAHPDAHGVGECDAVPRLVRSMPERLGSDDRYPQCLARLDQTAVDDLRQAYLQDAGRKAESGARIVDKTLNSFMHLGLITLIFPDATLVSCRRDPVDTCLSCYFEPLMQSNHPYACDLTHLGLHYLQYDRLMTHWRNVIPGHLVDMQYEILVADQEDATRRLLEQCDLEWNDACLRFHETRRVDRTLSYDQVRRTIYDSSVGRAASFGSRLDPLRAALGVPA